MVYQDLQPIGQWRQTGNPPAFSSVEIESITPQIREPVFIIRDPHTGRVGAGISGQMIPISDNTNSSYLLMSSLPALYPEWLGDRSFLEVHNVRFPYIAGAMYKGISSADMVIAMGRASMLGFFGAGGMTLDEIEKNIFKIKNELKESQASWGSNFIFSPTEPGLEDAVIDLYLRHGVRRISAAAFMSLTPAIVQYSAKGLYTDSSGRIQRTNHIFAKISRPEVAKPFMEPAPKGIIDQLVKNGKISQAEGNLAMNIPVAEDITVEGDSGGHTDNRPLVATFPTVLQMRNEMMSAYNYPRPIRIGAAGGLGTPSAVAAAFSMGAAYVLTGSVNQSAIEAGISDDARQMLGQAEVADVTMAPAADMFELGVKVQVLKKGTMFCNRAANLYQIYSENDSIDTISKKNREKLEKEVFKRSLEKIWEDTCSFFEKRNPNELAKAKQDPKYKMSLIFRWYLGNSAMWAINGNCENRLDYQICCGPSIGAFNTWVNGTFLSDVANRTVVQIALNLMEGAAVITRAQQLRSYGLGISESSFNYRPRPLA